MSLKISTFLRSFETFWGLLFFLWFLSHWHIREGLCSWTTILNVLCVPNHYGRIPLSSFKKFIPGGLEAYSKFVIVAWMLSTLYDFLNILMKVIAKGWHQNCLKLCCLAFLAFFFKHLDLFFGWKNSWGQKQCIQMPHVQLI